MAEPLILRPRRHAQREEPVRARRGDPAGRRRGRVWFLATAWPGDPELDDRIARHRAARPASWPTVQVGTDLAAALAGTDPGRGRPDRRLHALAEHPPRRRGPGHRPDPRRSGRRGSCRDRRPARPGHRGQRRGRLRDRADACRARAPTATSSGSPTSGWRPRPTRSISSSPDCRSRSRAADRRDRRTAPDHRTRLRADLGRVRPLDADGDGGRGSPPRPTDEAARQPRPARGARHPARGDHRASRRAGRSPGDRRRGRRPWGHRARACPPIRPRSPRRWSRTSSPAGRPSTSSPRRSAHGSSSSTSASRDRSPQVAARPGPRRAMVSARVRAGTADMTVEPAMTRDEALAAIDAGRRLVAEMRAEPDGLDLLGIGEMGIGNTTAASALAAVFTGAAVESVTGPGHRHRRGGPPAQGRRHRGGARAPSSRSRRPDRRPRRRRRSRDRGAGRSHRRGGRRRHPDRARRVHQHGRGARRVRPPAGGRAAADRRPSLDRAGPPDRSRAPRPGARRRPRPASRRGVRVPRWRWAIVVAAVAIRDGMATFDSAGVAGRG